MKLVNNNISPLPFYDDINFQNHRKDYAFGHIYNLITYMNMLLPFQVILSSSITGVTRVMLCNFNTNSRTDITQAIITNGLSVKSYINFTLLKYPGKLPISISGIPEGLYYLEIVLSDKSLIYSDIFTVSNSVENYLLLEYSNSYNFELKNGIIDFSDDFVFKCYLDTQIGKPEYSFEEEATERAGYSFIESQVSKKIYKFTFIAPEYLCDALRIVRLCDNKQITCKSGVYDLMAFSMEPEWQDQGDLASVECEFETDTIIANIGGYQINKRDGGDFSEDFNNDYLISK